jgi:hypothetical protein
MPPSRDDNDARTLPRGLLHRLREDPLRAPEHVALAAAERMAPDAAAWVGATRARLAVTDRELALMAKRKHASLARMGGAATGIGGFITAVPDLVIASWIQARLVFFIAAAYGYDPFDPMRPAELLVLQGLYPDPQSARKALDGVGTSVLQAWAGSQLERDQALASQLASMVGRRAIKRFAGRLIPFAAIAFNAIGNERETRARADRTIKYYGG